MSTAGHKLREDFNLAAHRPTGWHEDFFTNQYDHKLRYGHAPAIGLRRGTIVLTHGYGEFVDQYFLAIREYQAMGYDVWAMDHYGFGKSGREDPDHPHRPSTKGLLRHVNDLDFFVHHIVKRAPTGPLVLSTHSMGGHIALLHLQRHPGVFDGAIMSAPMFDIFRFGLPLFTRPFVRGAFNMASLLGMRDKEVPATPAMWDKITRVSNTLATINPGKDNLRSVFKELTQGAMHDVMVSRPTFGWVAASFTTIVRSMKPRELAKVKTPVLIGSAGVESLVDISAHEHAARRIPNATLIKLPTAEHNLWFETPKNYEDWLNAIHAFLHRIETSHLYVPPDPMAMGEKSGPNQAVQVAFTRKPNPHS